MGNNNNIVENNSANKKINIATKFRDKFCPYILIILVLGVWYITTELEIVNNYVLPSPKKVLDTFIKMVKSKEIIIDIIISLWRISRGFIIAFIAAFALGMFRVFVPRATKYYEYIVQFFRNIPPMSMLPLFILWFGIGEMTKTIIIVLASFFPMYLSIVKGFSGCSKNLIEVGEVFGFSKYEKFRYIILPYALADIVVGMRIGMGYSLRAIIGAEMAAASTGLGHLILYSQHLSRTDKVIIGILVIGIIGLIIDRVFGVIIKKCFKGFGENGWN